ncbi:MAG TPA: ABC transporter permease [Micromonosporaceae bacterium]|nr:ABC transporter permease [Micromonosporaceae bacterium]
MTREQDPAVRRPQDGAGVVAVRPVLAQVEREARVWARMWRGSTLTGVALPWLVLAAMGLGLGGMVDQPGDAFGGLGYLVFVAPGLLAGAAVQFAAGAATWPVMGGMKWTGSFHAATATPLSPMDVYGGFVLWIGIRLAMNAVAFLVAAVLLGAVPSAWGLLAVPAAVLGGLAVAAPLAAFAATQDSDQSFELVERLVVVPMFLLSGVFFPVDQLPAALRLVVGAAPLWHAVELCRGATTGSLGLLAGAGHTAVLAGYLALGAWWGARTFPRRLAA